MLHNSYHAYYIIIFNGGAFFMKKNGVLILFLVFIVSACRLDEDTDIKIIAPNGSPSLSQVYIEYYAPTIENVNYEIDIIAGAEPLIAAFGSASHDIIFAPTNLGARLIDTGVPYVFAATINWGNSYLVSKSSLSNLSDLEGKEIVAFGQNATPDIVLRSILNNYDFDLAPIIRYVDSVQTALAELLEDNNRVVLLAEPILSIAQVNLGELNIIDLQEEWEVLTGMQSYPQAGVFVHKDLAKSVVNAYLEQLEIGIDYLQSNPNNIAQYAVSLGYPFPEPVLRSAIPRSNIRFLSALESKESLEIYFQYILDLQGNLINNKLPDDSFYYTPEE